MAVAPLTALGFRIVDQSDGSLEFVGAGMNSTRQSALLGASRIHLAGGPSELTLEAELGGVARMSRFAALFPLGLCLLLFVVLSAVFGAIFGLGWWVYLVAAVTGGNALLWLVLAPILSRFFKARTCQALDALLNNMAVVGGGS